MGCKELLATNGCNVLPATDVLEGTDVLPIIDVLAATDISAVGTFDVGPPPAVDVA